MDKRQKKTGN